MPAEERAAGFRARLALGRAIRSERLRRASPPLPAAQPARAAPVRQRPRLAAYTAAAAALAVLGILAALARPGGVAFAPPPPPPGNERARPTPLTAAVPLSGKGRITSTLAPIAAQPTPEPTPQPTAEASAAPSQAPPATAAPGSGGGQPGGVPGGTPGGVPGGAVGGTGTATPRATPTAGPTPTPNVLPASPPPVASGQDRIQFLVLDIQTRRALAGVCVVVGTETCSPSDYHTNANGQWWIDVPKRDVLYEFTFILNGYATRSHYRVPHTSGRSDNITVFLSPS